jgi:hypothetical protein
MLLNRLMARLSWECTWLMWLRSYRSAFPFPPRVFQSSAVAHFPPMHHTVSIASKPFGSKDWVLLCLSCLVSLMDMCSRLRALLRALQGGPKASGTFVCLRLLRDSAARITVRILRQDKMEIVPKPQPSVRPQVLVRVCILKLTLDR